MLISFFSIQDSGGLQQVDVLMEFTIYKNYQKCVGYLTSHGSLLLYPALSVGGDVALQIQPELLLSDQRK